MLAVGEAEEGGIRSALDVLHSAPLVALEQLVGVAEPAQIAQPDEILRY